MFYDSNPVIKRTIDYLYGKKNILLITTSNRYVKDNDQPKSTALAYHIANALYPNVKVLDIPQLNIYPCEGNVSAIKGNNCGVKASALLDKTKNPTGNIRCWASYNNADDELYKVANAIFEADTIIFFSSVRWGQTNSFYQRLIERLDWIENRKTTLQEGSIIEGKEAGFICLGQNWNGNQVCATQKQVLNFFGFKTPDELFWYWQFTKDANDETQNSYKEAIVSFENTFQFSMKGFISKFSVFRKLLGIK